MGDQMREIGGLRSAEGDELKTISHTKLMELWLNDCDYLTKRLQSMLRTGWKMC